MNRIIKEFAKVLLVNGALIGIIMCPVCSEPMEQIYKELTEKHKNMKPIYVCRNNGKCKGWFCDACQVYHPYGTTCAVEMVHDMRKGSYKAEIRELENFVNSQKTVSPKVAQEKIK